MLERRLRRGKEKKMGRYEDGMLHIQLARESHKNEDYLGARVEYMKAVESFKQANATYELESANTEYSEFVKTDPVFKLLSSVLIAGIKNDPGIMQSEITNKASEGNWSDIYHYNRPILKDDVYYVLYFADKFGMIKRTKKGRSYELFANEILLVHPFPPPFPKAQGKEAGGLRHPGKKAQRQKRPSLLKFVNSAAKTILSSSALPKGRHRFLRCIVFLYGDGIFSGV
jgi:hypothetical protein